MTSRPRSSSGSPGGPSTRAPHPSDAPDGGAARGASSHAAIAAAATRTAMKNVALIVRRIYGGEGRGGPTRLDRHALLVEPGAHMVRRAAVELGARGHPQQVAGILVDLVAPEGQVGGHGDRHH